MSKDEFNIINITNESTHSNSFEFGVTQKSESSSYEDNKTSKSMSDAGNDSFVVNESVSEEQKREKKEIKNNKDLIEKAVKGSEVASTAGGVTASVAASASVIAVAAISVSVGISVVTANNATVTFKYLQISSNSLSYELFLNDTNSTPFLISVSNNSFYSEKPLVEGLNEGYFEGLKLGDTYRLTVQENTDNAKVIYDQSFATINRGYMQGLQWDKTADFKTQSFTVRVDYEDEANRYSDFQLALRATDIEKVFSLETTNNEQIVSVLDPTTGEATIDIRHGTAFTYEFTYFDSDSQERIVGEEGEVTFTDNSGAKVIFSNFEFASTADFVENTADITLTYVDDLGYISSDITLVMTQGDVTENVALTKTTDAQTVAPRTIKYRDGQITYHVEYINDGEEVVSESKTQTFTDKDNRKSEFTSFTILDKADFENYTFDVNLNYVDDLSDFSEMTLVITEEENEEHTKTFDLSDLGSGTHTLSAELTDGHLDIENMSFKYEFSYKDRGEIKKIEGDGIYFEDKEGRGSFLDDFYLENTADFKENKLYLHLYYKDDFERYGDFKLVITDENHSDQTITYNFDKETYGPEVSEAYALSTQYNEGSDPLYLNLDSSTFDVTLSYKYNGEEYTHNHTSGAFFTDKDNRQSVVNGVEFKEKADFENYTFNVKLYYQDDFDCLSNFVLTMTDKDNADLTMEYVLDNLPVDSEGYYTLSGISDEEVILDIRNSTFKYSLSYNREMHGTTQELSINGDDISFTDESGRQSQVGSFTVSNTIDLETCEFEVTVDYVDDFNELSDFVLELTDLEGYNYVDFDIATPEGQTVGFNSLENLINYMDCNATLKYKQNGKDKSITLGEVHHFESLKKITVTDLVSNFKIFPLNNNNCFEMKLTIENGFDELPSEKIKIVTTDGDNIAEADLVNGWQPVDISESEVELDGEINFRMVVPYYETGIEIECYSGSAVFSEATESFVDGMDIADNEIDTSLDPEEQSFKIIMYLYDAGIAQSDFSNFRLELYDPQSMSTFKFEVRPVSYLLTEVKLCQCNVVLEQTMSVGQLRQYIVGHSIKVTLVPVDSDGNDMDPMVIYESYQLVYKS